MSKSGEQLYQIFKNHVPDNAVPYCLDLWYAHPFTLKLRKQRSSKLGDYKYDRRTRHHVITLNNNLNRYLFLITYIHEVAHLLVTKQFGLNKAPHGAEWKGTFQSLMRPMLSEMIFPVDILDSLQKHMQNPKASSQSDPALVTVLRRHDPDSDLIHLEEISEGDSFVFKGRRYTKLNVRRTRVLCMQCHTGRKYLIPKIALVSAT